MKKQANEATKELVADIFNDGKTTKEVLHTDWVVHSTGMLEHKFEIHSALDEDGENPIADIHLMEGETIEQCEARAELICKAVNERQKLIEALKAFHAMFIHVEGEPAKNKIKTDMIKHCEEVKEALNNSRSILYHATNE